jgi:hypothetical protein
MRYPLSSPALLLDKVIIPAVWISSVGIGVGMAWSVPATPSRTPHPELITLFWLVGTVLVYFSRMTLKTVELDDRAGLFYISNLWCTIEVPLTDFVALKPSFWSGRPPVLILRLRQPSAFGRAIPFVPNLPRNWRQSRDRLVRDFIAQTQTRITTLIDTPSDS